MSEAPLSAKEQAMIRLKELNEKKDPRSIIPAEPNEKKNIRPVNKQPIKKKFGQKLREAMFSEDIGNGSVTEYVFFKVMIPAIKRVVSDMANTAINMALGLDPKTKTVGATHTSNASLYRDRNFSRTNADTSGYSNRRRDAVSDFMWDEETARDIYTQCIDTLERFPSLCLSDVYGIMNKPELILSTDLHWGWTDPRSIDLVEVDPVDHIYKVVFAPAKPV